MTRSGRTTKLSLIAAATALALTGCGSLHPGVAAVVGSHTISDQKVDDVARAVCSANSGGGAAPMPSRHARQLALQVLLENELAHQLAQEKGVTASKAQVSRAVAQADQGIAQLPADQRDDFREALTGAQESQLVLLDIGRKSLESQGKTKVTQEQAQAEGNRLLNTYTNKIDVKVDPRYGSFKDNTLTPGGKGLSVAVSPRAADGESPDPSAGWVASLPASQLCS